MNGNIEMSPCKDCNEQLLPSIEADHIRQHLAERDDHIISLEAEGIKNTTRIIGLEEQVASWREKYERLYESHKRVQKLNQNLEEKLLQMVDKIKGEKSQLTKDIATLSLRLAEAKHSFTKVQKENERYKNDMNLAIQLLQCKPDNFVSQKLDSLSTDTQARVSQYIMSKTKASSPTAKVANETDTFDTSEYEFNISASLMAKILEESIQDTITKHCESCTCTNPQAKPFNNDVILNTSATQTNVPLDSNCSNCDIKKSSSPIATKQLIDTPNDLFRQMYIIPQKTDFKKLNDVENDVFDVTATEISNLDANNIIKHSVINESVINHPVQHHRLCDQTKSPESSKNSSLSNELVKTNLFAKQPDDGLRKCSHSSMGGLSVASSLTKSTSSTHKSNTHVGPGPRFCSLRVQAGSKNILLDNAQPDVPPILYRRQNKFCDDALFKDCKEETDLTNKDKILDDSARAISDFDGNALVDVTSDKNTEIAPNCNSLKGLIDMTSSPLRSMKLKEIESNENESFLCPDTSASFVDNDAFSNNLETLQNAPLNNIDFNKKDSMLTPNADNNNLKLFNFDNYEQHKLSNQYPRPFRSIDMSQLHAMEKTKISKDCTPNGSITKKKSGMEKVNITTISSAYPRSSRMLITKKKDKHHSSSSLSSDDSASMHKQQLIRVAEWVDNLETEEAAIIDEEGGDAEDNEAVLNMPHPVSKFSKNLLELADNSSPITPENFAKTEIIAKETVFPVIEEVPTYSSQEDTELLPVLDTDKKITLEDITRMEYNVRKFLNGQYFNDAQDLEMKEKLRRTSSKTETDV